MTTLNQDKDGNGLKVGVQFILEPHMTIQSDLIA